MHVRVGSFFSLSPSCSLVSVLAMSAALVSVSHQSWLTNHDPCAMLFFSHHSAAFSHVSRRRQLCGELRVFPSHSPPGEIQMLLCWTLKWGIIQEAQSVGYNISALTQNICGLSSQKCLNTSPALKNRRKYTNGSSIRCQTLCSQNYFSSYPSFFQKDSP